MDLPAKSVSKTAFSSVAPSLLCNKTPEAGKSSEERKKKVFKVSTKNISIATNRGSGSRDRTDLLQLVSERIIIIIMGHTDRFQDIYRAH